MEALFHVATVDLIALASALRSQRLNPPFHELAIARYCTGNLADIRETLEELMCSGLNTQHIALLIEAMVTTRKSNPPPENWIDLVWTGPECEELTNRDTGVVVRELFGTAQSEVLIAGFAVYQGKEVFQKLAESMEQNLDLRVRLILDIRRSLGDTAGASELVWKFVTRFKNLEWPSKTLPELFYDPRSLEENQEKRSSMHAKCVCIDRKIALVTSANFTEAAQNRNLEVGALIKSSSFTEQLVRHFESLIKAGLLVPVQM
jgi:phosphatidylserine/phosphatidylglycerophosphate/cardiolipin synthase-like enzyme